jgi:hypothetical protein
LLTLTEFANLAALAEALPDARQPARHRLRQRTRVKETRFAS